MSANRFLFRHWYKCLTTPQAADEMSGGVAKRMLSLGFSIIDLTT